MSVSSGPSEFAEPPSWEDETEEYVLALGGYDQDEGRSPGPAEQHQGSSSSSAEQQQTAQVAATSGAGDRQPSPSPALGSHSHPPQGQGLDEAADHAHRTVKSYDLGEKFTGTDKQANSLEVYEFISRVKAHLKLLNIPPCNHYQYLLLNTRLAAYNTLTNNVRLPINDPQAFEKGILVLQERFGVGRHDLWALARTRRLNVGETTSDLMGDLQKYLSYSLPEVLNISRQCLDWALTICARLGYPRFAKELR
ncbi:hypothetical protein FOZ60_015151 [Perkinsus olseni]|uniref:Uncharacterized protein n=1 Tax=Perkinsus olseni TaxID=32597 RepID=A0A7J6N7B8_PEROL|nr:hypothetical protein FOZ60_015151 [Perkinsus olseni]